MLEVSQYKRRGRVMTHGEWRRILQSKMLLSRADHNYVRHGSMVEDLELASEEVVTQWSMKLGLEDEGGPINAEVIELLDLTPPRTDGSDGGSGSSH